MNEIWQACKSYFGDGYVSGSSPFRFDVHVCDIQRPTAKRDSHYNGIEIDEDMFASFSHLGEPRHPRCTCHEIAKLAKHIDNYLQTAPDFHDDDYSFHTNKDDKSAESLTLYSMRDALCWWSHWAGSMSGNRWKHLYLAFAGISDDMQVPPQHLVDGTCRVLGHTLADLVDGLRSEGMHPEDVEFAKMCLLREFVVQYLEKTDPRVREMVLGETMAMSQLRSITGNTHGVAVCLAAARGVRTEGTRDIMLELSGVCDALSVDMAKEAIGVLDGENTETVAGNRKQLKQEVCWVYSRSMSYLESLPNGLLLRRFASAGLHLVPSHDRYLERIDFKRRPIHNTIRRMIDSYSKSGVALPDWTILDGVAAPN